MASRCGAIDYLTTLGHRPFWMIQRRDSRIVTTRSFNIDNQKLEHRYLLYTESPSMKDEATRDLFLLRHEP